MHALQWMAQRNISAAELRHVLATGRVIEDYPNDTPCPSYLMLGWIGTRPLHVVAADQATIVITVYEPDPRQWTPDYARRKP